MVVLGYKIPQDGKWSRDGLEIVYTYEGARYRQVLPGEFTTCSTDYAAAHPTEFKLSP
jgi:hypothetical protein